jgi:DNA-binding PadR family transcriptional regulator
MIELCILGFLAETPLHAYALRRRITALIGHVRPLSDGALTPPCDDLRPEGSSAATMPAESAARRAASSS